MGESERIFGIPIRNQNGQDWKNNQNRNSGNSSEKIENGCVTRGYWVSGIAAIGRTDGGVDNRISFC